MGARRRRCRRSATACRPGSRAAAPRARARRARGADRALRRDRPEVARASPSATGTIRSRPASSAAGPTACRSCRRPTSASCACWRGTERKPDEVVGLIPPNLPPCTVEKVAINAVMAGCKPEYMPVVLGVLEAALDPLFTLHGLLCTTHFSGPLVIINGPIAKRDRHEQRRQRAGPGQPRQRHDRPRAAAHRAQRRRRHARRDRPRDARAIPASTPSASPRTKPIPTWEPLYGRAAASRPGKSAVTLFHGEGVHGFIDQKSRTPEELVRSLAMGLFGVGHPKLCEYAQCRCWCCRPSTTRSSRTAAGAAGKSRRACAQALKRPGKDLVAGRARHRRRHRRPRGDEMVDKFSRGRPAGRSRRRPRRAHVRPSSAAGRRSARKPKCKPLHGR